MAVIKPIVYLRGLNGEGKENLYLGPLPLPLPMTKPWCSFFRSQGAKVYAVTGLGMGRLSDQVLRAEDYLQQISSELEDGFHLVGHSAGGLIGWALASRNPWNKKVLSLTTLATPHQGAVLAELFLEKQARSLRLKILNRLGYKTGWGFWNEKTGKHIGWVVGWIEENQHPYFFCVEYRIT